MIVNPLIPLPDESALMLIGFEPDTMSPFLKIFVSSLLSDYSDNTKLVPSFSKFVNLSLK